jgi:hypothetical protein
MPFVRFKFFSHIQEEGQTIDDYVTELKTLSQHCEFGELKDSLIRDKIVIGVNDIKLRERLLKNLDLSLETAIQICRAAEEVKKQSKEIQSNTASATHVDFVRRKFESRPNPQRNYEVSPRNQSKTCNYCGNYHDYGKCPAYGKTCKRCQKKNHFESVCKTRYVKDIVANAQTSRRQRTHKGICWRGF